MKKSDLINEILKNDNSMSKKQLKTKHKKDLERILELSKIKNKIDNGQDSITEHGLNVELNEEDKITELYNSEKDNDEKEPDKKDISIQVCSLIDPELEIRMKYLTKKIFDKSLSQSARDKYTKLYNKYKKMISGDMYN